VSANKQDIVVSRAYSPAPDRCARALELLLKPVNKKAAGTSGGEDAKVRSGDDSRAKSRIP
jgi:hypothetical protein